MNLLELPSVDYFLLLQQDLSVYSTQCPVNLEVFYSGWWEQALFLALYEHWAFFLQILSDLFCVSYFPHVNALLSFLLNT